MERLFKTPRFVDFGPCYLRLEGPPPAIKQIQGNRSALLRMQVRQFGPKKPGVYGMLNVHGELVYVGKAKNLRSRLLSYFRTRSRDPKARRIIGVSKSIVWDIAWDEFSALHRELELIRRWRPRLNVLGQPDTRKPIYLCLGKSPAPFVFLTEKAQPGALVFLGPFANGGRIQEAVRRLNDCFQLRDCPQSQEILFAEQKDLFPVERSPGCLRFDIGTCLAPCAGQCRQRDYNKKVKAAQAFLRGEEISILEELREGMAAAANNQEYEKAASLRDKLEILTWLLVRIEQMYRLRNQGSFIYPLEGLNKEVRWYLIHGGQTVAGISAPKKKGEGKVAAKLIERIYSKGIPNLEEPSTAQRDSELILSYWFRRYPEERDRLLNPEDVLDSL